MTEAKENVVYIGEKALKESDMTDDQKYLTSQITDLRNKKARIQFELDQVQASLTVFENTLVKSTEEELEKSEATEETETKILEN